MGNMAAHSKGKTKKKVSDLIGLYLREADCRPAIYKIKRFT